jgi:CBS domain-containing membrane protein
MADESTLMLDIDEVGLRGSGEVAARVALARARGFTRDGAAPTITEDCTSYDALTAEVDRLRGELDGVLKEAATFFEAAREERAQRREVQRSSSTAEHGEKPRVLTELRVDQVMTREVRTLNENDHITMAEELMSIGRFRHVVVVNDGGRVTGVVSHRDIFYSTIAWSTGLGRFAHEKAMQEFPVKQVMTEAPQTISPETPLSDAAAMMMERKIGCLPVLEGEKLVGILTEGDFLAIIV